MIGLTAFPIMDN